MQVAISQQTLPGDFDPQLPKEQRLELEKARVNRLVGRVYAETGIALALTIATAVVSKAAGISAKVLTAFTSGHLLITAVFFGVIGALIISAVSCAEPNTPLQKGLFAAFAVYEGIMISPLALIHMPAFLAASGSALLLTAGLGTIASHMKAGFEQIERITLIALGVLTVASFGSLACFGTSIGAFFHEVSFIGGFGVFGGMVVAETMRAREYAKDQNFDVTNHAVGIYLSTMNLMIRLFEAFLRSR